MRNARSLLRLVVALCATGGFSSSQLLTETDALALTTDSGETTGAGAIWVDGEDVLVASHWFDEILVLRPQSDGTWVQDDSIEPAWTDGSVPQWFGYAMSVDGSRALFAQPNYFDGGAAVYEKDPSGTWVAETMLEAPGATDAFALQVGLSGDWAMVSDPTLGDGGVVHVFQYEAGTWSHVQELDGGPTAGLFGLGGIVFSGDQVLIGDREDATSGDSSGAVTVFELSGGTWTFRQKLTGSQPENASQFGAALSVDGDTAAISDYTLDAFGLPDTGGVYIFERQPDGSWSETELLLPDDWLSRDHFGTDVSLRGELLLVGSEWSDDAFDDNKGAAYLFQRRFGDWVQVQKSHGSNAGASDSFGRQVFLGEHRGLATAFTATPLYAYDTLLSTDVGTVSLSAGGSQELALNCGPEFAGRDYWVLGSATGDVPGFKFGPSHVPLNVDPYTVLTITNANRAPFLGTQGTLDGEGMASAQLVIPSIAMPVLVGLDLHHAFLVYEAFDDVILASNPTVLTFEP